MNIITDIIRSGREYADVLEAVGEQARVKKPLPLLVCGLCEGARFAFLAALREDYVRMYGSTLPLLILVPDEKDALRLDNAFNEIGVRSLSYPLRDLVFHNITASHEYEHERLGVLSSILSGKCDVVIATPDAALQYTVPPDILTASSRTLKSDGTYDLGELCEFLTRSGYVRVEMVDGVGQFSVRGGIVDIFPPRAKRPVRMELFGDEVEQLGEFDILTQRRTDTLDEVLITPAREITLTAEKRAGLHEVILNQLKKVTDQRIKEQLRSELDTIEAGMDASFLDKYISYIYDTPCCLLDYFANAPSAVLIETAAINERVKTSEWHTRENITTLLTEQSIASKYAVYTKYQTDLDIFVNNRASIMVDMFAPSSSGKGLAGIFTFQTKQTVSYAESFELLCEDAETYLVSGWRVTMLCETEAAARNTANALSEKGLNAVAANSTDIAPTPGTAVILWGMNVGGYELVMSRYAVMSLYLNPMSLARTVSKKSGGKRKVRKQSAGERIMAYTDLEIGDYVVHQNHGIGCYQGLMSLENDGVTRDYVKIKYNGSDMLYLPIDQLDMVSKYIGAKNDDGTVKLSKMGGTEWAKAKSRAKAAAKDMAKELIQLYAERMRKEGFAFLPDDDYQREFEASFEYEETDGQLEAIEDIKRDMERINPMDRLLCGDVGFGKTEVALRAAFKAVASNKQVAILVPTTILAMQHYQTLLSRMRGFPVKIEMISRFRTQGQQAEILRRLRRGDVDIIVGTHRLVSADIKFKDLGLVIIDEEQRFGVAHKEKLKQLCTNIDVLTLTATPIPRTLNMAMSGIRDMSVLEEAPGDRSPVQTYVLEHDELILGEAIRKELRRGGQVFYLHNKVEDIDEVAGRVQRMAGDARIAVAHGQMDKEYLSDIWRSLVVGDVDILVSTTIIETGVDVPNANTLIIDDSDRMGLSQLHQIRGRIGRSNRRAYAYLTYPKGKVLSEVAAKRLGAIREYTEFGSGFKVAMRDLEIRGAGNLLGSQQHGHIESVGYDLYMKLLNEAILEEKGADAKTAAKVECTVEMHYDAYLPEKYIRTAAQRIDAYKKIASIENKEDYTDITDELLDRYGDIPKCGMNLLKISLIRGTGSQAGISRIEQRDGNIVFFPAKLDAEAWANVAADYKGKLLMNVGSKPYISYRIRKEDKPLDFVIEVLDKYLNIKFPPEEKKK